MLDLFHNHLREVYSLHGVKTKPIGFHVWDIYLPFPLNVAIFHLMYVNIPYTDHMRKWIKLIGFAWLKSQTNQTTIQRAPDWLFQQHTSADVSAFMKRIYA